jgi:uncharacterized protein (TIRG00374 family)
MRARDYLRLLFDSPTIARTLSRVYGTPRPPAEPTYSEGMAAGHVETVHPARVRARVVAVVDDTPSTRTLTLEGIDRPLPPHLPGQYVNLFVEVDGTATSRPMSISSPRREDGRFELTIRRKPGGFVSGRLLALQVGDELMLSGVEGDFCYQPVRDGKDLVFLAAGSGIAPFTGMIEEILERHADTRVSLLHGDRTEEELIFRGRLEALAARHPGRLTIRHALTRPSHGWAGASGRINRRQIEQLLAGASLDGKSFFVCGPPAMEQGAVRALEALGVRRGRIRIEPSGSAADPTTFPGWPSELSSDQRFSVELEGRAAPIPARAGETLLASLERAGIAIPVRCRSGSCGSCRTRLRDGRVVRAPGPGQRGSEAEGGFIHACVSHPVSDLKLVVQPDHARPLPPPTPARSPAPAEHAPAEPRTSGAWGKSLLALGGLGLFVYLVASSGITLEMLARVGWVGFGLVLALSLVAALADTTGWALALRHVARPTLGRLFGIRTGGDALTNSLPGGIVLGEPFKALALRRWLGVSLSDSAASQLTVKFGLGITQALFVLAGLILVYPLLRDRSVELFGFAGAHYIGLAVIAGFLAVMLLLLVAVLRGNSFGAIARAARRLPIRPLRRWLDRSTPKIAEVDASFSRVYAQNRRRLPAIFAVMTVGWLAGALESYVLLRALGQPVSFETAFAIESVGSMFRLLFFLVPSGIGGQDASLLALFRLFNLPKAAGGAFVLLKRVKELAWIGLGFILVAASRRRSESPAAAAAPNPVPDGALPVAPLP